MYGSTSSPQLFSDSALFQLCTKSQGTAFYLLVPCSVLPLSAHPGGWVAQQVAGSTPTSAAALSLPWELCTHHLCVSMYRGCLMRWQMPCSPSTDMGRDIVLRIETETSPGKKKKNVSNCLEVLCIHCPEANNSGWTGFSPVTQGLPWLICWRMTWCFPQHDVSCWGKHHVILGKTLPTFECIAWHLRMWWLGKRGQVKTEMCVLVWKRDSQIFSFTSLILTIWRISHWQHHQPLVDSIVDGSQRPQAHLTRKGNFYRWQFYSWWSLTIGKGQYCSEEGGI